MCRSFCRIKKGLIASYILRASTQYKPERGGEDQHFIGEHIKNLKLTENFQSQLNCLDIFKTCFQPSLSSCLDHIYH